MGGPSYSWTTLFYGITVETETLHIAAKAWTRLAGPSRFVDLIISRRQTGVLQCRSPSSPLPNFPTELWIKIRKQLIEKEVLHSTSTSYIASLCPLHKPLYTGWDQGVKVDWSVYDDIFVGCKDCVETWHGIRWGMIHGESAKEIRSLLNEYRLALPHEDAVFPDQKTGEFEGSVMLIALPSRLASSKNGRNVLVAEADRDGPDEHTIVNIDFSLPSNPDRRFLNLVKSFNLWVVDVTADTLVMDSSSSEDIPHGGWRAFDYTRPEFSRNKLCEAEIKPRWKLWTTCHEDE